MSKRRKKSVCLITTLTILFVLMGVIWKSLPTSKEELISRKLFKVYTKSECLKPYYASSDLIIKIQSQFVKKHSFYIAEFSCYDDANGHLFNETVYVSAYTKENDYFRFWSNTNNKGVEIINDIIDKENILLSTSDYGEYIADVFYLTHPDQLAILSTDKNESIINRFNYARLNKYNISIINAFLLQNFPTNCNGLNICSFYSWSKKGFINKWEIAVKNNGKFILKFKQDKIVYLPAAYIISLSENGKDLE